MKHSALKNLVLSAMFLAIGIVLPFFTGQIPQIGKMLLPMHLPVFLCGLICGWQYGLAVGLILPVMRSSIFFMPAMFPTAIAMSFELAAYGAVAGFLYKRSKWQCIIALYRSLIIAMLAGRLVWGCASAGAFRQRLYPCGVFCRRFYERRPRNYPPARVHPRGDGRPRPHRTCAVQESA